VPHLHLYCLYSHSFKEYAASQGIEAPSPATLYRMFNAVVSAAAAVKARRGQDDLGVTTGRENFANICDILQECDDSELLVKELTDECRKIQVCAFVLASRLQQCCFRVASCRGDSCRHTLVSRLSSKLNFPHMFSFTADVPASVGKCAPCVVLAFLFQLNVGLAAPCQNVCAFFATCGLFSHLFIIFFIHGIALVLVLFFLLFFLVFFLVF
jgi:hypothetical protein